MQRWWQILDSRPLVVLATVVLSACNVAVPESAADLQPGDDVPEVTAPVFGDVVLSHDVLPACDGVNLSIGATLDSASNVSMRYRIKGFGADTGSDWLEVVLQQDSETSEFRAVLPELGAQSEAVLRGQGGTFEYQLVARDATNHETVWPSGVEPLLELPIEPCGGASEYAVFDYGPSSSVAGYGPVCAPHEVTFDIVIGGAEQVESVILQYQYYAPAGDPQLVKSFEVQIPAGDPDPEYPDATRFALTVDVDTEASTYMEGESGSLGWNIYVKLSDQQVFEYPVGGPPMVEVSACAEDDLGVGPNPTSTPLGIAAVPTPTPTQRVIIGTVVLYHSQGEVLDMLEGEYFDLDEGVRSGFINNQVDFQVHEGSDPYLDDIKPVNFAYFGWHGQGAPSESDCEGTLKATAAQTIAWPDMQDSYFCYETNEGRAGWLKVQIWVSLPLNERHLEFSWGTFQ